MRLVCDNGKPLALLLDFIFHLLVRGAEGLDRADDDLLVVVQRVDQLPTLAARPSFLDRRHDALGGLQVKHRILQLQVDRPAVAHHQHRVEHLAVLGIVQLA